MQRFLRNQHPLYFKCLAKNHYSKISKPSLNQLGTTFNQKSPSNSSKNNETNFSYNIGGFKKLLTTNLFSSGSNSTPDPKSNNGLFGIKNLDHFSGFYELQENAKKRINVLSQEAKDFDLYSSNRKRNLVHIFDDISNELCRVADLAEFIRTSHPDINYRQAANMSFASISQIVEKLNTNLPLYQKLKQAHTLAINGETSNMDECDKRVCNLFLNDFEQSGIHLDEKTRNKFVNVNDTLLNYITQFQANTQAPTEIHYKDIDPKFIKLFKYHTNPVTVDTMYISSNNELLREFVYKTFLLNNKTQESNFRTILTKRKELANLCEFETYSHRANANMIMDTPDKVVNFLDKCSKSIYTQAEADFEIIRNFKKKQLKSDEPLMQWDIPYLSSLIKKNTFNLNKAHYCNYFSLGSCIEGLNLIVNSLYNVNLEATEFEPGETWNNDIYKLVVRDAQKGKLGYIYCDFYQRPDKFSNIDCHFTIQCSKQLEDDTYQLPIVVLHLNLQPPTKDKPTLLTFEMMENLFHEFGHAIHSMFAKTRYQHVSGTRCSTDLAEVPSQLMEYYCRDPRILKLFAKHWETLEPLDERIIEKLCQSKKFFAASELQSQLLNSLLDQAYHLTDFDNNSRDLKPIDVIEEYTNKYHSLPFIQNAHTHLRYTHLVGYGAKYYSYVVSKAIAAKIWTECFEKDPLCPIAGQNYRKKLLEFGGEKRPEELIKSLTGYEVEIDSLVESLVRK